jgi:hypothetical protein
MKTTRLLVLLATIVAVLCLAAHVTHAQNATADVAPAPALADEAAPVADLLTSIISPLVVKYPIISTVIFVIGLLRLLLKPLVEFLRARVAATADLEDDRRLAAAEASWWWKALLFILDWGASIKPLKK